MRLPDDYEDHGGGLTPTVISAIVAVTIFRGSDPYGGADHEQTAHFPPTEQYGCTDGECTTGRK